MLLAALNETNGITIETLDCLYAAALGLAAPGMRIKKKSRSWGTIGSYQIYEAIYVGNGLSPAFPSPFFYRGFFSGLIEVFSPYAAILYIAFSACSSI